MKFEIGFTQHHGKNKRYPKQQDALWNGVQVFQERNLPSSQYYSDLDKLAVAVADGVAISPVSEQASRLVLESIASEMAHGAVLEGRLIRRIHGSLCDALAKGHTFGSSSTLVAAAFRNDNCVVANAGDSRAYKISADGKLQQLSHDHTLINSMIARGEAEAGKEYASFYYTLDSCLVADDEEMDFLIHLADTQFLVGDSVFLCSDGVHDVLNDEKISALYNQNRSAKDQVDEWRRAVLSAGAPDNLSIVLVRRTA